VLSLGGIIFVGIAVFFGFQESFSTYVETRRDEQIVQAVEQIEEDFRQNGTFTNQTEMTLHRLTMEENVLFQLYSASDELLFESSQMGMDNMNQHHGGNGRQRSGMMGRMMGGKHMCSETLDLYADGTFIGTITVQFPTSFAQTENQFLADFIRYLLIALVIMTGLAILFSFVFSKQLTKGIKQIGGAVHMLKDHQPHQLLPTDHRVQELKELSEGVNELADSLEKGEQLRKQFTSDLAHELRTPLSTLRSQLESFQDGVLEPTSERLVQSYEELMRLVRLVNEMEQLHAAENPRLKLDIKTLETNKVLTSIHERFHPSFQEKGISLVVNEEESYEFAADLDRFIQVMTNLLNNAWKFTPSGKKVEVSVAQDRDFTHFIVADQGNGMSEEEVQFAYDRFYRGEKSRNREQRGGLGIGLAIVKALIEAHNGQLHLESEKGIGTTFTVSFPNEVERYKT